MKVQGYATIVDPVGLQEYDTCTCGHCQKVIFVKPGSASTVYLIPTRTPGRFLEEPGAFCRVCMRPVCLPCHEIGTCTPFEKQLDAMEAAGRLRKAAGL